jgi:multicomponent Na+:H+ antiporter subunit F
VIRGPTLPDRVVGLDLFTVVCVGAACTYAISTGEPLLLYPAAVLGLLAFLGTITVALYLERRIGR